MSGFAEYLKELPILELVMLQHEARKVDDMETLRLVLIELREREVQTKRRNEQTTIP